MTFVGKALWPRLCEAARSQAGSTTTIFAITALPLIGAVGLAVDYASINRTQAGLQSALDGGVLAAAEFQSQTASSQSAIQSAKKVLVDYVNGQFHAPDGQMPTVTPTIDAPGTVVATASISIPSMMGKLFGVPSFTVNARSQATFGSGAAEIALVFDTTASMAGVKLTTAQAAAQSLVDTVFAASGASANVRMALVPFDVYVNVGLQYRGASWLSNTQDWSTTENKCQTQHPNAVYGPAVTTTKTCLRDGMPYSCTNTSRPLISEGPAVQVCGPSTTSYKWKGCVGSRNYPLDMSDTVSTANPVPGISRSCSSPIVRLTNDPNALKLAIAGLKPKNETYIAPGLLWGWRTLSPNAPFGDGSPSNSGIKKSMVLMTDGFNTHAPNYPLHDSTDTAAANTLTAQTCSNIKAAGIAIYTIAFEVTDATIKGILANCASAPTNYFDANSTSALSSAFAKIGSSLTAIRLAR